MKVPANAIPDSTVITFIYKKGEKNIEFTAESFPDDFNDSTYTFVDRYDKVIRKGINNEPPIKAFGLVTAEGKDVTQDILQEEKVLLLFMEDASTPLSQWKQTFEKIYSDAKEKNIPVYIVTSTLPAVQKEITSTAFKDVGVLGCDNTTIRTAARTNPTLYLLQKGTVTDKESFKKMDQIKF